LWIFFNKFKELLVLAEYIRQAKSSMFVEENLEKIVKELNVKFEEKGLNTRLSKKDLIQKLSEDIQKLKTKIHLKNKRYEPTTSHPIHNMQDLKVPSN
jgi:galactitol-specific phosphotransferase system IIB component